MLAGALIASSLMVSPASAAGVPTAPDIQPSTVTTATTRVQAPLTPVVENPRTALNAMVWAFRRVKTYTATQVISGTQGYITQTVEFVAPSTMHMMNWVNGKSDEHVIIGNTLYVSTTKGWQKSQLTLATLLKGMNFAGVTRLINAAPGYVTSAKYIGPETVNGVLTQVYEYQMRVSVLPINATATLWIGADHLPYRMDTDMTAKYSGKTITNTTSALLMGYNTPITITVPISVTR
jgi:hypothetical protein